VVPQMPIPQVSVYLDNRPGSLSEAMAQLDKNQIKVFALSIADAGEFGLVRMITEDPEKSTRVLEDVDYNLAKSRKNTEVTAVFIGDENKISKITKILADGSINIEYAYSSAVHVNGKIALILRASDVERGENIESKRHHRSVTSRNQKIFPVIAPNKQSA
jgi:hypothetical protein